MWVGDEDFYIYMVDNRWDLKDRDKLVNFRVTKVSLCGMRMTISRGTDKQAPRPSTKLQAEILQ